MFSFLTSGFSGILCSVLFPIWAFAQAPALSFEDILNLEVTTSSKSEESFLRATSVMSVITKSQIEASGARNLTEVLQRVPGFFPSSQATWTVTGSRGLVADGTDHILLLIDGHSQNSILENGYQQQDKIPNLDMVDRIEIIRGPGSVLWGSSAVWGIVNIITVDSVAGDGEKTMVKVGYSSADQLSTLTLLQGLQFGNSGGFINFSTWGAKGYDNSLDSNVKFPWSSINTQWPNLDKQYPSFEIYSKVKAGKKHDIKFKLLDMAVSYPWDSSTDSKSKTKPGSKIRTRKTYIDYTRNFEMSEQLTVSLNINAGMTTQLRHPIGIQNGATENRWVEDLTREETLLGSEINAIHKTQDNTFTLGMKFERTEAGPNRSNRFDTSTNLPTVPDTGKVPPEEQVNVIGIKNGEDQNISIYLQDKYSINKGTDIFGGLRFDKNNYREDKTVILPRAGIISNINSATTLKYIYNTGYLRPNAVYSKSGGKFFRAPSNTIEDVSVVDKSETIVSQDLQYFWAVEEAHIAVTLFHTTISNFISWETATDLGYRNLGNASSQGVELEAAMKWDPSWVYGNISYAQAELSNVPTVAVPTHIDASGFKSLTNAVSNKDGGWLNYPKYIVNLGVTRKVAADSTLNLNARGWLDMKIVGPYDRPSQTELEGAWYLDANYLNSRLWDTNLSLGLTITNILDNIDPVGMVINNGVYLPRGRSVGFSITSNF